MKIGNNIISEANLYCTVLFYLLHQRQMGAVDIIGTQIFTIAYWGSFV